MLYKIDFETETATGWVEGDFGDEHQANEISSMVTRLSNLCRLYENEFFKLMPQQLQQWLENESIQMRVIVLGDILEVRFYSDSAAIRSALVLNNFLFRMLLIRTARELGQTASSFKVQVMEDVTKFRTVDFRQMLEDAYSCN